MEGFPAALIIASRESVFHDNNVLYRLVRPLLDGSGVESTDRLVNVVPFRRTYLFEQAKQVEDFRHEILRRPLVLQPVLHFGRGLGRNCGACYQDEPWIVMINQTHPKILSRLQMGLDTAKKAIERRQSCEIRFRFGKLIQRVYREHLIQKETGEAQATGSSLNECLTYFRFAQWEYCDLIIRYHGLGFKLNRNTAFFDPGNLESKWDFEDIGMHEMVWSQLDGQIFPLPHMAPVYEDEIRELLPAWTINSVSPLEELGDSIPEHNYSYAQAGRLYESFRKKKRARTRPLKGDDYEDKEPYEEIANTPELEGAVGYEPSYKNTEFAEVEHDINPQENYRPYKTSAIFQQKYQNIESHSDDDQGFYYNDGYKSYSDSYTDGAKDPYYNDRGNHYSHIEDDKQSYYNDSHKTYSDRNADDAKHPYDNDMAHQTSNSSATGPSVKYGSADNAYVPQSSLNGKQQRQKTSVTSSNPDRYGHIHANVEIKSHTSASQKKNTKSHSSSNYNNWQDPSFCDISEPGSSDDHHYMGAFKKQDSDRSSRSTNADSGYCPEVDGERSRGNSYDYNDQVYTSKYKQEQETWDNYHLKEVAEIHDGLENPAFRYNDPEIDSVLKKHKDLIASKLHGTEHGLSGRESRSSATLSSKSTVPDVVRAPPRHKKAIQVSNAGKVAESYI